MMRLNDVDVRCACCGEESVSLTRVADGREVCRACLMADFALCDICGEYYPMSEMESEGWDRICSGCATI